jgi:hypothetical protein
MQGCHTFFGSSNWLMLTSKMLTFKIKCTTFLPQIKVDVMYNKHHSHLISFREAIAMEKGAAFAQNSLGQ